MPFRSAAPQATVLGSVVLLAWLAAGPVWAGDCVAVRSSSRVQLIELYTSEGCSSCPPADRWLATLDPAPGRIRVAFHVDYWDELGWPDRFAAPAYSARQRRIAQRGGLRAVYTPAVRLNGSEWRWTRPLPGPASAAGPELALAARRAGDALLVTLQLPAGGSAAGMRAYLALTEGGLHSIVARGENAGTKLRHEHVVRVLREDLRLPLHDVRLPLPPNLDLARGTLVAVLEDRAGGVQAALSSSLAACARR